MAALEEINALTAEYEKVVADFRRSRNRRRVLQRRRQFGEYKGDTVAELRVRSEEMQRARGEIRRLYVRLYDYFGGKFPTTVWARISTGRLLH
jgi:hypothetical protein